MFIPQAINELATQITDRLVRNNLLTETKQQAVVEALTPAVTAILAIADGTQDESTVTLDLAPIFKAPEETEEETVEEIKKSGPVKAKRKR